MGSYIGQTVPQILIVCIFVAVLAEVSHDPSLKHFICQKVSQHVQDTSALVRKREKVGTSPGGSKECLHQAKGKKKVLKRFSVIETF